MLIVKKIICQRNDELFFILIFTSYQNNRIILMTGSRSIFTAMMMCMCCRMSEKHVEGDRMSLILED